MCFDVFKGREEGGVAGRVFEEGEAPAGEDAAGTDFTKFEVAVLPYCGVFAAQDVAGTEADG